MDRPSLLPTSLENETFAGVTYHLDGNLVPVLTVELTGKQNVFFEHHVMLWKNTTVTIGIRPMKGALKRMFAGMQIFMTEAQGSGQIAFSRDGCGHIFPIHMDHGREIDVREHQFLAATSNLEYSFQRLKGFVGNVMFGGNQFFIDKFVANQGEAILWLHGYGNVFEKKLEVGEQIDVEPGAWLYKDPSVKMETKFMRMATGLFGGSSILYNRFTGPGRIGIQSMSLYIPPSTNK